jgi:uncharacterized protein YdhG (YjbR/CyaY superfamily)
VEERGMAQHFDSVDEYIAQFPADVQDVLQEVRRRCRAAVPGSAEKISYGIPTVTLGGKYVVVFRGLGAPYFGLPGAVRRRRLPG